MNSDYHAELRRYDAAHKVYMNTPVQDFKGSKDEEELREAEAAYLRAVKTAHPDWIVF